MLGQHVTKARLSLLCLSMIAASCSEGPQETSLSTVPAERSSPVASDTSMMSNDLTVPATLSGAFEIIAVRRSSGTAVTAELDGASESPLGQTVKIAADKIEIPGRVCAPMSIEPDTDVKVMAADPMLADLHLPSLDGSRPPQGVLHHVNCVDGGTVEIYQSDPRAIAIPWQNGAVYLVAERPMAQADILGLQTVLGGMKFINGDPSGIWDGPALSGLRAYYDYRDTSEPGYVFERPAITASLLEKIGPSGE